MRTEGRDEHTFRRTRQDQHPFFVLVDEAGPFALSPREEVGVGGSVDIESTRSRSAPGGRPLGRREGPARACWDWNCWVWSWGMLCVAACVMVAIAGGKTEGGLGGRQI
jgi:hypothetical protein